MLLDKKGKLTIAKSKSSRLSYCQSAIGVKYGTTFCMLPVNLDMFHVQIVIMPFFAHQFGIRSYGSTSFQTKQNESNELQIIRSPSVFFTLEVHRTSHQIKSVFETQFYGCRLT
jgi:hypothetical protein